MSTNFDVLLENLHIGGSVKLQDAESNSPIMINERREFIVPSNFNTVIAYEGDINSQIITFDLPLFHEGHDLSKCSYKKLLWKNLSSGIEGKADLKVSSTVNNRQLVQWTVPADTFAQAGQLEISISIYDLYNGEIAFAWNTASCSALSVAKTMNSVGQDLVNDSFPARDEILIVNDDTRQIIAPAGYNNVIAYQGDVGINEVHFLIKRYIKGIDVSNSTVYLYYKSNGITKQSTLNQRSYSPEIMGRNQEGMILLTWKVPDGEGELVQTYNGKLDISLKIDATTKSWHTGVYTGLEIKPGFTLEENDLDDEIIDYLQNRQWRIDGDSVSNIDNTLMLSGLVSLRTYNSSIPDGKYAKNELVPEYDPNGNLVALHLNTTKGLVNVFGNIADIFEGEYIIDCGSATELID